MKKFLSLILVLTALVSCGSKKNQTPENIPETENISETTETAGITETAEISEKSTESKTTDKSGKSTDTAKTSATTAKSGSKETTKAKAGKNSGNTKTEKNDSESKNETPEPLEYREFNPEDFSEVDINIIRPEDEPPVITTEYALELPDTGGEYSPCKAEEYRDEYRDIYSYRFMNYETMDFDDEKFSSICDSDYEGRYVTFTFDGRYLYYIIDFDNLCEFNSHCFKVMKYDTETAEIEELYSYSEADYRFLNLQLEVIKGDVYISYDKYSFTDNERVSEISIIKKGKLEKIIDDSSARAILELTDYDTDKLILSSYKSWFDENGEFQASGQLYEYNSGKVNEIYSVDFEDGRMDIVFPPMRYRNEFLSVERDENKTVNIYSDHFRLNTGLRGAKITSASDKVISFIVEDTVSCFMYVYNFETMERYKLNVKGLTDEWGVTPIGDNFILSSGGRTHAFLIPEIGATFLLKSFDESYPTDTDGKIVWIIDSQTGSFHSDINGNIASNKPSMLYVIEPQ